MHDAGTPADDQDPQLATVYWRPGCYFCNRLFRHLDKAGVTVERRNIWEDEEARGFVRAHNDGCETVPTVAVAGRVLTNPEPKVLLALLDGSSGQPA
ncbi:MAG TPA: glutaredoxin domain-containing protein [Acidimicrobiales bacterium]|nr:glutaredoxin domain-containing protein [Acidimicrobiales bacterium]